MCASWNRRQDPVSQEYLSVVLSLTCSHLLSAFLKYKLKSKRYVNYHYLFSKLSIFFRLKFLDLGKKKLIISFSGQFF